MYQRCFGNVSVFKGNQSKIVPGNTCLQSPNEEKSSFTLAPSSAPAPCTATLWQRWIATVKIVIFDANTDI